jgi:hypothetical protein
MTDAIMNHQQSLLRLHMLAAIWGCCYPSLHEPEERDFVTIWKPTDGAQLQLSDAAENGAYSLFVEGLIVSHALATYRSVDPSLLHHVKEEDTYTWTILRSDWKPEMATPELWEQLRSDLYAEYYQEGRGSFAYDLKFADLAINWLKTGAQVEAGCCSGLARK